MVFQDEQLFPHRDVAANVAFGLRMQGVPAAERDRRVAEMLALVGLDGFGARRVTDLSGGEAKRVALARSLAPAPGRDPARRAAHRAGPGAARPAGRRAGPDPARRGHDGADRHPRPRRGRDRSPTGWSRWTTVNGPDLHVVELRAADTHDLRRRVLRDGTASDDVVFAGDDDPATVHLGLADRAGIAGRRLVVGRPARSRPGRPGGPRCSCGAWPWTPPARVAAPARSSSPPDWSGRPRPAPTSCGPTPGTPPWRSTGATGSPWSATASSTPTTGLPHHRIRPRARLTTVRFPFPPSRDTQGR